MTLLDALLVSPMLQLVVVADIVALVWLLVLVVRGVRS